MNNLLVERDQQQRKLALDPSRSFIVEAPAGSGKTELLIQRFLTLLAHVNSPEEILAITFTKKAANEMRLRIMSAIKIAQTGVEPEAAHKKLTFKLAKQVLERDQHYQWHLTANPNQLRIQTIDSLCAYLTKQLPLLSHFGASPEISDNPFPLYREAVQEILMHVEENYEWSTALAQLLLHLDNDLNKLHDLLVNLLSKRDQWLPYISLTADSSQMRMQLESHLELVITETLQKCYSLIPKDYREELLAIARFAATNLNIKNNPHELIAWQYLTTFPSIAADNVSAYLGLAKLLLTKSHTWRKRLDADIGFPPLAKLKNAQKKKEHTEYRKRLIDLIHLLSEAPGLYETFCDIFFLPATKYEDAQWNILQSLLQILKIAAAQLRLTFRQYGQIDFIENTQAALLALGSEEQPTDLALALDYQIKHILVDEFQDTSLTQYQLLQKLITGWEPNDGRTLFVVGDPMQSIYRFREAEVGLFIRMTQHGIGNLELTSISLAVNFRSLSQVVDWNNLHFQAIFPMQSDIATGAVIYNKSVASNEDSEKGEIDIKGLIDADNNLQAKHIVTLIHTIREKYPLEKIAILVRSRTHLISIVPALKKAQLSFRAVEIDSLVSKQYIQDLLSLTCALLHPADRIAWLALLRAPWCGLTLTDLFLIANKNPHLTLWERLQSSTHSELSADGQARLNRILPILASKITNRGREDLRTWIETAWIMLGGPACLPDKEAMQDTNAYFNLLESFSHAPLHLNLEKLKEKVAALYATPQQDDHATLQIMTIHSAKGLEFDTVILPHLEKKNPYDDKSLLAWMERPLSDGLTALLLAPLHATGEETDPIYQYIYRQQRYKIDYETDRLLYVATTRAKKRLYLFFNVPSVEDKEYRIESGSFLEKLWPILTGKQAEILHQSSNPVEKIEESKQRHLIRLQSAWQHPIKSDVTGLATKHFSPSGFSLTDKKPTIIGIVMHKLLQLISEFGLSWWSQKSIDRQKNYLQYQLIQEGLRTSTLNEATEIILKAIDNTLTDERGRWILHPHQHAASELALTANLAGKNTNLVIDRTFVSDDTRWIIDYKTATFTAGELDHFLTREYEKYAEKMYSYYQAMQKLEKRPIKLGLYFPVLPAWKEWEFPTV